MRKSHFMLVRQLSSGDPWDLVGVLGKEVWANELTSEGPGFVLTIAITDHINYQVPRGCRG